jgi:uncharacterized Zn finger protein
MNKIACPNCGNEVELTNKGIVVGEEFGNCKKCGHIVLVGYNSKDKVTSFDPRKSDYINYLMSKSEGRTT